MILDLNKNFELSAAKSNKITGNFLAVINYLRGMIIIFVIDDLNKIFELMIDF